MSIGFEPFYSFNHISRLTANSNPLSGCALRSRVTPIAREAAASAFRRGTVGTVDFRADFSFSRRGEIVPATLHCDCAGKNLQQPWRFHRQNEMQHASGKADENGTERIAEFFQTAAMPSWRAEGKVEDKIQIAIGGVRTR